ncbi:cytochrome c [Alteromonas pelagimontana]|uniref:Cytochrome c n=1 Tax=Alteromonas pelagimontana TaxID=1858656 RepID=A0A6M4M804_9ALTE|nr:cytochrome c [Alteromonas pelagimontana]QJR79364.1 cytochrome c [Alteromonas pelagimontana]
MTQKKYLGTGMIVGIVLTAIAGMVAILIVVYTGSYNISAREDHSSFARWALSTSMVASVRSRADQKPPGFTKNMIAAGAHEYQTMCEHCHGGPGIERANWAEGLVPQPPHLTEAAAHWTPSEVFWLVNHGVKMSGMPAFGATHDEKTLWNITAFVKQLPAMTQAQYQELGDHNKHDH